MEKPLHSGNITFVDLTDSKKVDVHISSNLPTIQIYNGNVPTTYSPDWESTPLVLTLTVYADSTDITNSLTNDSIKWCRQIGNGTYDDIQTGGTTLRISNNELIDTNIGWSAGVISYICSITYNNKTFENKITFARTDTGTNGSSAPAVQAQYSANGSSGWTATLNTATHKYIRYSYDGGKTWTVAIKMVGEDGTSVNIKGTATSKASVSGTSYYTLVYNSTTITGAALGDAYLLDGNLYVCVDSRDGNDYFMDVGTIQGPQGNDGQSSYVFIRYATNASGANMTASPTNTTTHIGICTVNTNVAPTTASAYTWSKFVGDNAKSIVLSGDSQVFKINKDNVVTPTTIKVTAQAFNTTITNWTYSTNGGQTFLSTVPTGVSRSGNTVTITGSTITSNSLVIKASDGFVEDVFTIYKAMDGVDGGRGDDGDPAPIAFLTNENVTFSANAQGQITGTTITSNVVAYNGTTKVLPTIGTITSVPTGMTITPSTISASNEIMLTITIANNSTLGSALSNMGTISIPITSPVSTVLSLTWSKVNTGTPGSSASLVDITPSALYFKSSTGKDGIFDPEYIYLYPRFQNATYNGWQYSTDGGVTWINVTIANGLSVGTYNSVANTLRISRASVLYTDTITSISFRCNSLTSGIYDTVSIAKIYDVVDLQIGGRNYIPNTEAQWTTPGIASNSAYGVYRNGLNSVYEQLVNQPLMVSFEGMVETTDGNNGQIQIYGTNNNPKYRLNSAIFTNITPNQWQKFSAPVNIAHIDGNTNEGRIEFYGVAPNVSKVHIRKLKLEIGNKATDWTPASEDLIESASNTTVMLSNEAHLFEADLNGVPIPKTIEIEVTGLKGATQVPTTVGAITGFPSTGMSVSTSNNNTTSTKIVIGVNAQLTSSIADAGVLNIPITVNGRTINKVFSWAKSNDMAGLQISGRNLLLNSGIPVTNAAYPTKTYSLASAPIVGDQYTLTLKGKLGDGKTRFGAYNSGGSVSLGALSRVGTSDIYTLTFNWVNGAVVNPGAVYIYPIPNTVTATSTIEWIKLEKGNKATADWSPAPEDLKSISFQLYAPKGYLITHDVPEVTLQTFAYDGSQPITSATFKWYSWSGEAWTVINNATSTSLTVNKNNVLKSNVYKCEMTYGDKVYEATATVEDKTDIYESLVRVNAKRASNNNMYWILYATVYSEEGERDALLGPISETAPANPTAGSYWYQIDSANYTVTLKKYSGTTWATTTDKQELFYDWYLFRDSTDMVSLGDTSKVKIIKSGDFINTCNVQCNIFDAENTVLSRNNQVLNDPTDPIVSEVAPTNPIDGQMWIKIGTNNTYTLSVWNAQNSKWIVSNADTQNKVYVTKPTQYNTGDLWIVDSNYSPVAYEDGVMKDYKHPEKTMLMATATSQTYSDAHWVEALKYQKELDGVVTDMKNLKQFISIDDTGLTMQAKAPNGAISEFKTMLTNTDLGFYQGATKVAYINNNQLNISKAEITNGLTVSGTSPTFNIGNFTLIQESNGSLSIG